VTHESTVHGTARITTLRFDVQVFGRVEALQLGGADVGELLELVGDRTRA